MKPGLTCTAAIAFNTTDACNILSSRALFILPEKVSPCVIVLQAVTGVCMVSFSPF